MTHSGVASGLTKMFWLPAADVLDVLAGRAVLRGLPEGATLHNATARGGKFGFVVWHESFPVRDEGAVHPTLDVAVEPRPAETTA